MWLPHAPPTGDLACNTGMCLDCESNQRPFGCQAGAQSTEPQQPELCDALKYEVLVQGGGDETCLHQVKLITEKCQARSYSCYLSPLTHPSLGGWMCYIVLGLQKSTQS